MSAHEAKEAVALLALSHTPAEHRLYEALVSETEASGTSVGTFSLRHLMAVTGFASYTSIRRARAGLAEKLSIDCKKVARDTGDLRPLETVYLVYRPAEIFARRCAAGLDPYPKEYGRHVSQMGYSAALERVASSDTLSRREAQIALCCVEGMTNAEIGEKLFITEETVKFHLRHVFAKFGVRRRGELISRLLRREDEPSADAVATA
ncbi:MAG: response regulator transcription factor [Pyrinomonadaceae bacterium]